MAQANGQPVQIPIIDISGAAPESQVAKELVDAAVTYGFVYIKNEGKDIPVEVIDHTFDLSRKFFSSPTEEKEKCKILENNMGWSGMHTETLDAKNQRVGDFKEAMNFGEFLNGKAQQILPPALIDHENDIEQFEDYCFNLCMKILTLFGIGLEIPDSAGGKDWFASRHARSFGPSGRTLRILHYPSIPEGIDYQPEVDIRAGAHSDYGSITLLFQRPGQPGLELLPPSTNTRREDYGTTKNWTPVPVLPPGTENDPSPPILVNIGDLLDHWTKNLLKSTVHRVVFPKDAKKGGEDRYSIAYFCHPASSTVLEAVPSKRVQDQKSENGEATTAITAQEHLLGRLKASYLSLYRDDEKTEKIAAA
ncbi:clavaminate synthase-like protein [Coleophoma cylindrospora]|uniref:Clavaminate synthase-like protein n=1 Tax=Coleophoma cylindrospora TaxID=1849047 RepID=A0A3D8SQI4_9HELO|nr:clavaminate synthase-like protein [Coleophoma cylindrospora]